MGVFHFMGLGRSIGAVTCAVDYIEKALDVLHAESNPAVVNLFRGSGGIDHQESDKGKIEALVLFTSKEVIENRLPAFPYSGKKDPGNVREEIVAILKRVWKRQPATGRKIFWCEVDIDDFQDCFDKIVKVTYRFSPPRKQGKEIWCNLSGGTNAINFATLSMGQLTGKATKHYFLSQRKDYRQEIMVPNGITSLRPDQDDYFHILPFLKTAIDVDGFYEILLLLNDLNVAMTTQALFDRLRSKGFFLHIAFDEFKRQHMLKLSGYTEYDAQTDQTKITPVGSAFIHEHLEPLLTLGDALEDGTKDWVEASKQWAWLTQEVI